MSKTELSVGSMIRVSPPSRTTRLTRAESVMKRRSSCSLVKSPRMVSKIMWKTRLINHAGMFLRNARSQSTIPRRLPSRPAIGRAGAAVGSRGGGTGSRRTLDRSPDAGTDRSVRGAVVSEGFVTGSGAAEAAGADSMAALRRSNSRLASHSCSMVNSMLASHRQQSAIMSHKRTVIGAWHCGQAHINTSPSIQNIPVPDIPVPDIPVPDIPVPSSATASPSTGDEAQTLGGKTEASGRSGNAPVDVISTTGITELGTSRPFGTPAGTVVSARKTNGS